MDRTTNEKLSSQVPTSSSSSSGKTPSNLPSSATNVRDKPSESSPPTTAALSTSGEPSKKTNLLTSQRSTMGDMSPGGTAVHPHASSTGQSLPDLLRRPENTPVVRRFVATSLLILVLPICTFFAIDRFFAHRIGLANHSTSVAAIGAVLSVQAVLVAYIILAWREENSVMECQRKFRMSESKKKE